jgi:hypothetical protein
MKNIQVIAHNLSSEIYQQGIKPCIVEKERYAYIDDPVFHIKRNRVVAEVVQSLCTSDIEANKTIITKLCNYLLKTQNPDGSWNEIHLRYNQPSGLITSIVGEALLQKYKKTPSKKLRIVLQHAADFVLSQEKSSGYYLKSKQYTADHLNVDACCGAFLAAYGKLFSDTNCTAATTKAAEHDCHHQLSEGSFPYTIDKGTYSHIFKVPCIHYQAVTLHYLLKIVQLSNQQLLLTSIEKGTNWLAMRQKKDGKFDWSQSGLMFAYYLSGAYGFGFSCFASLPTWQQRYYDNALACLKMIALNKKSLCYRWEKGSWSSFPLSFLNSLESSLIGNYSSRYRLFRYGYGMYRQIARRRMSEIVYSNTFFDLTRLFKISTSTVEPFSNYPDLFMTSEILQCLTSID